MYSFVEYSNEPKQEFNFRAIPLRCVAKNSSYGKKATSVRSWLKINKNCNLLTIDVICLLIDKRVKVTDYQPGIAEPCTESLIFDQ